MRKLENVDSRFGAPMGRADKHLMTNPPAPWKFHLQRIRIDSGGYDSGGAYWGLRYPARYTRPDGMVVNMPKSLFWCFNQRASISFFLDAFTIEEAKQLVRADYPLATFYP